jgi:hypothetical protein
MFFIRKFDKKNVVKTFYVKKFNKKNVSLKINKNIVKTFYVRKFNKKKRFATFFFEDLIKTLRKHFMLENLIKKNISQRFFLKI